MIAAASFDETPSRPPRGVDGDATSTGNKGGVLATVRQGAGTAFVSLLFILLFGGMLLAMFVVIAGVHLAARKR